MRPPILFVTLGFGVGLWMGLEPAALPGEAFPSKAFSGGALWGAALPVLLASLLVARRAPLGAAIGLTGVAGLLWGTAAGREQAATCQGRWTTGERSTRAAIVRLADPVPTAGGVVDADVVPGTCAGELKLRWPEGTPARGGTTWVVAGRWAGAAGRGTLVVRRARQLDPIPRGRGAVRDGLAQRTAALFGTRAPLVDALVFAPRVDLEAAVRERYARSGLAHILSISGLHVGFLAAWLALLLAKLRLPHRARMATAAVVLVAYLWLIGFPAPALRAVAMLVLSDVARIRQRVVAPAGTLSVAALIVLLIDPWAMRAVGAWLSIAAMGAVIWADRAFRGRALWLRLVAPSIAAALLTAPISALAFGTVAPIGVVANLVAIPLAAVVVPGLALALALSWIASGVATLVAAGSGLGLALLDLVARGAAAVPGGHVVMMAGWPAAATWAGVAALAWWLWHSPRRPWLIAARIAFASTVLVAASLKDAFALDDCVCLTVHFLDVGQGDAAALRTPHGRWIVIDGGPRIPGDDAGRRVVVPFLRRQGVERLAVAVATHGDADHLGGLPAVVDAFDPEVVLEPGEPLGRPLYLEFLAAVEASGARWHAARAGDRVELDGVVLEVLSPDTLWLRLPLDVNEHGVVIVVTYGAERLLFQADAGLPVEARLAGQVGRVELLKVGHHGSRSATSDAWLDELAPREAVISVGRRNRYGHPTPEVLGRLARHGITVLRTDERGTITFSTDGHGARLRSHHD
ncbi:MAG: DNA internalization-related competence protein ComEC/Rec2 [Gemmatimonadetes bacterium]|nr:MAG: DNA internalization-related competence protein ComEC/Rec2 [Gemmatimonadota bacterium]